MPFQTTSRARACIDRICSITKNHGQTSFVDIKVLKSYNTSGSFFTCNLKTKYREVIAIYWLWMLLGFVLGAMLLFWLTSSYYKKGLDKGRRELEQDRVRFREESEKTLAANEKAAENRKRELLLQAKEEVHKAKLDLDQSVRDRRAELSKDFNRMEQREEQLGRKLSAVERREKELDGRARSLEDRELAIKQAEEEKQAELERVSGLSQQEAQKQVLDQARLEYRHDMAVMLRQMEEEAKETADARAKEIIVGSIQRYASDYVSDATVSVVNLPNEEMKGRIIGREGRNIRTLENLTGVDLIIDDTPEAVILSSFDPIRREIARLAIEKLVFDGRIHPARIEEMVEKARREVDQTMKEAGEQAVFETGVVGLHPEIVKLLGRMKYRTSYGQNVLQHSIEVCWLTGAMAAELGLDVALAKRAGLLHDLGKAIDFELEGSHVELGADMARKYHEQEIVINAIESHHGDVEVIHPIAALVAAADAISAARPGARRENVETYIKRIEKLEEIASSFTGVEKVYAVQAGREIRVMVKPDVVKDDEMILKAHEVSKKIEDELSYPGQIKVQMIRESRVVDYAK